MEFIGLLNFKQATWQRQSLLSRYNVKYLLESASSAELQTSIALQAITFLLGCYLLTMGMVIGNMAIEYIISEKAFSFETNYAVSDRSPVHVSKTLQRVNYISDLIVRHSVPRGQADSLAASIVDESRAANIDPLLVAAIVKTESTFKVQAVSKRGATGLMQLMPSTGKFISNKNLMGTFNNNRLLDPRYNLRLGIAYLNRLLKSFNSVEYALIAYNWGPANLSRALRDRSKIPMESLIYARKIMDAHKNWGSAFTYKANAQA